MTSPTRLVRATDDELGPAVEAAAEELRRGGLVAFPTETVYGLGALATDAAALARVFAAKGRPTTDPLIVHVPDATAASGVVVGWDDRAAALAARFWPGPLTLVLGRSDRVDAAVGGGRATVAVRVPAHPVALELLRAVDGPVAAPSANRFGGVSPTTAAHVVAEHLTGVAMVLDGGACPLGVESTVLDLTGGRPTVLRHGGVTVEDLATVLGDVDAPDRAHVPEDRPAASPGQFLRHYAPSTPLVLVEGRRATVQDLLGRLADVPGGAAEVALPEAPDDAARGLYAALREADGTAGVLVVAAVDPSGIGRAVNDRLFRAATGLVVTDATEATAARVRAVVAP